MLGGRPDGSFRRGDARAQVKGIVPDGLVTVVDVQWHGSAVIELTYKDAAGHLGHEWLFRDHEPTLEVLAPGRLWNFDVDGALLRLVSEAYRIRLASLFAPRLAVHTSLAELLPHQIIAVYGEMLTRQPLRCPLSEDPGTRRLWPSRCPSFERKTSTIE